MLNRRPSYLYHEETQSTLVVPPYLPLPEGNFTEGKGKGVHFYLVMMSPQSYVKTIWKQVTCGVLDLKWFIMNTLITEQTRYLPNPEYTIRYEYFTSDCLELGITATIPIIPIPQKELCLSSSVYVRKMFARDYQLGEYD